MAPTFTFKELAEDLGTNTADGLRNIANTAANFACDLYRGYAGATAGWDDPTGIGAFNNALYSRLCGPRPGRKPPPSNKFTGGQCNILYNVVVAATDFAGNTTNVNYFNILGPIGGIVSRVIVPPNLRYDMVVAPQQGASDGFYQVGSIDVNSQGQYTRRIVSVTPASGGPDTCGNTPAPVPILPIPLPDIKPTNPVTVNVGGDVNITVPISYRPITFSPEFSLNPQIQVDVGPFNVNFDLGGVTISPNFSFGDQSKQVPSPILLPPDAPPATNPKPGTGECDCDDIRRKLQLLDTRTALIRSTVNRIEDYSVPINYTFSAQTIASGEGGVIPIPANCIEIKVDLTQIPSNGKMQKGGGTHPTSYFCGYYAFGDGVGLDTRRPLNTANNVFFPPLFATSFAWSLYVGYEANITAVIAIPEKSDSEFVGRQMKKKPA